MVRRLLSVIGLAVALTVLLVGAEALAALPKRTRQAVWADPSVTAAATTATADTSSTTSASARAKTVSPSPERTTAAVAPSAASVGVLARSTDLRAHFCTAAVVASTSGEVIVTAAHCLSGTARGLLFAPGYQAGAASHGTWVVTGAYVAAGWLNSQDPKDDVAFLTVRPAASNHSTATVQAVVGGYPLASAPRAGDRVRVTGYVDGVQTAVSCVATVYLTGGYPSFDCAGFAGGTSGGPWISAGKQTLTAVIGGLHQGGCSPDTSYSSALHDTTADVLARAAANRTADVLPSPNSDGC